MTDWLTDQLTYQLTNISNQPTWSRDRLEKLIGLHILKKIPAFCRTKRFITEVMSPPLVSVLGHMNPIHAFPFCFLMLSSIVCPGLHVIAFPSRFLTKTVHTFLSCTCHMPYPCHTPWFSHPVDYLVSGTNFEVPYYAVFSSLLCLHIRPKYLPWYPVVECP